MLRVGSDVSGCRTGRQPSSTRGPYRRPMRSDVLRRSCDALSDQMHRASIDSFQPETQRYALARRIPERYPRFPDPALLSRYCWRGGPQAGVGASAQRDGTPPAPVTFRPEDALDEIVRFFEARVSPCDGAGRCRPAHPRSGDGIFLEPRTGNIAARAVEPSKAGSRR